MTASRPERRSPTEILLDVDTLADDGLGHARHGARSVAIKGALPGEAVTARILRKRKGRLLAEAHGVTRAHEDRRRPPCAHFPRCGGCVLQHMNPEAQLRFKDQQLRQALQEAGVEPAVFAAPVSGPQLGYRRKARLGVKLLGSGVAVGFRESFSARVARLTACQTLVPELGTMLQAYRSLIEQLRCADRIPQLEVAAGDARVQVIIRHLTDLAPEDRAALAAFELRHPRHSLLLQAQGPDSIVDLSGGTPALLSYALPRFGLLFRFAAQEFTQVNPWINARLTADVALLARRSGANRALDLFCGIGNFSLPLARQGLTVYGLEAAPSAIDRARANARLNGLEDRCEFQVADLYDLERSAVLPGAADSAPLMLLDPPRSGAGPNLLHWLTPKLQTVIYVSCNPRTFATDAVVLEQAGLKLKRVGIYDMFPQTSHVETLGLFER